LSLAVLTPTVAAASIATVDPGDSGFLGTVGNQVAVAGATDTTTLFLQDGVENINLLAITMNIIPSVESIQEVNTTMNGADARYAEPSVINIITKGGTNTFHGTAYDFLQNDALDARDFFLDPTAAKPVVRYNLFGGNIAGPILKKRTRSLATLITRGSGPRWGARCGQSFPPQMSVQGIFLQTRQFTTPLRLMRPRVPCNHFPGM
jgi:hypothetical protein